MMIKILLPLLIIVLIIVCNAAHQVYKAILAIEEYAFFGPAPNIEVPNPQWPVVGGDIKWFGQPKDHASLSGQFRHLLANPLPMEIKDESICFNGIIIDQPKPVEAP